MESTNDHARNKTEPSNTSQDSSRLNDALGVSIQHWKYLYFSNPLNYRKVQLLVKSFQKLVVHLAKRLKLTSRSEKSKSTHLLTEGKNQ